jgi:hypothetical protein
MFNIKPRAKIIAVDDRRRKLCTHGVGEVVFDTDWSAFLDPYERHARHIMTICLRYLGTFDWHQDAASEIYLKLVKELNGKTFRSRQDFKNWLAVLVKHHCISKLRKMQGERTIVLEEKNIRIQIIMWNLSLRSVLLLYRQTN